MLLAAEGEVLTWSHPDVARVTRPDTTLRP